MSFFLQHTGLMSFDWLSIHHLLAFFREEDQAISMTRHGSLEADSHAMAFSCQNDMGQGVGFRA